MGREDVHQVQSGNKILTGVLKTIFHSTGTIRSQATLISFAKLSLVFQTPTLFKALMEVSSSSFEILLYLALPFKTNSLGVFLSFTTRNRSIILILLRWKPTFAKNRELSSKDLGYI